MKCKKLKNALRSNLLVTGMLLCHQPISCETWRDYIWNKLFVFKKENIPILLSSGIVLAAAIYFLSKRGDRGSTPRQRGMLAGMRIPLAPPTTSSMMEKKYIASIQHFEDKRKAQEEKKRQQDVAKKIMQQVQQIQTIHDILYKQIKKHIDILERIKSALHQATEESIVNLILEGQAQMQSMFTENDKQKQIVTKLYEEARNTILNMSDQNIQDKMTELVQKTVKNFDDLLNYSATLVDQISKNLDQLIHQFSEKSRTLYRHTVETILQKIKQEIESQTVLWASTTANDGNIQPEIKNIISQILQQWDNQESRVTRQTMGEEAFGNLITQTILQQEEVDEIINVQVSRLHVSIRDKVRKALHNQISPSAIDSAMLIAESSLIVPLINIENNKLKKQIQEIVIREIQRNPIVN